MKSRKWIALGVAAAATGVLGGACASIVDPERAAAFQAELPEARIVVFPSYLRKAEPGYDVPSAERLTERLVAAGIDARLATDEIPLDTEWGMNQARMWRDSALSVARYVAAADIEADYAMMCEFLYGRDAVGGTHVYFVDMAGNVVGGVHLNSHSAAFNAADLSTPTGCAELMADDLIARYLAPAGG